MRYIPCTYSMVQSPSWEANWFAASQETPRILLNPKVHYHTQKRLPPVPVLGQPNPAHLPTSHLLVQVPNFISLCMLRDASPRNTPPRISGGGVVYLRIVLSPQEASCMWVFLNMNVLQGGVVSTSPNPQAGGPPIVGCPWLLIQYICSYPPYRRPSLYLQPEDVPCRGDRNPLHTYLVSRNISRICKACLESWGQYLRLLYKIEKYELQGKNRSKIHNRSRLCM